MWSVTSDLEKKWGQGQGHPPFWAKIQIFNSFIKANFKVLNCFLSFSAHYHNLKKKKIAPSRIRTRVAWVMGSGHTTPASHIWCIDDHGTPVGYSNPVFLQLYRDWNDKIDKMDSAAKLSRCDRKHAKWKDLSIVREQLDNLWRIQGKSHWQRPNITGSITFSKRSEVI